MRRVVNHLPAPLRRAVLLAAKHVRVEWFGIPDGLDDLCRFAETAGAVTVLDIGAHVGQTSLELVRRLPGHAIHAFEPTPQSAAEFRKALRPFPQVVLHEVALDRAKGRIRFFANTNSQTNSMLENDTGNVEFFGEATHHEQVLDVVTETLDHWAELHAPDGPLLVKMDVQGAELRVLEGGAKTLRNRALAIYTEVLLARLYAGQADFFSIHEWMTQNGFELFQIYRTRSTAAGRALWADAMWVSG